MNKSALIYLLGELMSEVSEFCYYAGWLGETEYFVPELCRRAITENQAQYWGHGYVTPEVAKILQKIADDLGSWVDSNYTATGYELFRPFPIPENLIESLDKEKQLSKSFPTDQFFLGKRRLKEILKLEYGYSYLGNYYKKYYEEG